MIALDQDAVISRAGDAIEYVFFPYSGAISLMIEMADGHTVAIAAVGREGAVGILSVLGPSRLQTIPRSFVRPAPPPGYPHRDFTPLSPEPRDTARGPDSRQGDAEAASSSARPAMRCIRSKPAWPAGCFSFATASTMMCPAHPAGALANTRCATYDRDAPDAQAARAWSDPGPIGEGLIEIDPARLAAAACECHNVMHLEVEEMFATSLARSRAAAPPEDRRIPGISSGGTV